MASLLETDRVRLEFSLAILFETRSRYLRVELLAKRVRNRIRGNISNEKRNKIR